jgi:hypothetical protein
MSQKNNPKYLLLFLLHKQLLDSGFYSDIILHKQFTGHK